MANKQASTAPLGPTKPRQFRIGNDTLAELDAISFAHGLSSRAEAIRFLARKEAKRIREKSGK